MKRSQMTAGGVCFGLLLACVSAYSQASEGQLTQPYETPPVLKVDDLVPEPLRKGPHHLVESVEATEGFSNAYSVKSRFGTFQVHGNEHLVITVREINAIAKLREIKKTEEFGKAAAKSATSPLAFAADLVEHPVDTITGVPKGLYRFMNRVGEMVKGTRGEQEDGVAKELIGFSTAKRNLAFKLGVDVYSSNAVLQKDLNSVAWASYTGDLVVTLGMAAGPSVLLLTKNADKMNEIMRDHSPEDLRRMNRERLLQMNTHEADVDRYLDHAYYTPRHETLMVAALYEMRGVPGREEFLKVVQKAESEESAYFFQRMAELLSLYHERIQPIDEIVVIGGFPMGLTKDQTLVLMMLWDYGMWAPAAEQTMRSLLAAHSQIGQARKLELWTTGYMTPYARTLLDQQGIQLIEQASRRLAKP